MHIHFFKRENKDMFVFFISYLQHFFLGLCFQQSDYINHLAINI